MAHSDWRRSYGLSAIEQLSHHIGARQSRPPSRSAGGEQSLTSICNHLKSTDLREIHGAIMKMRHQADRGGTHKVRPYDAIITIRRTVMSYLNQLASP
jgi:hypothetical protein